MSDKKHSIPSEKKSISISGDVRDSNVFIGDNNTIIQKFFNIFKSDSETLEHRNRRILLGHVENAWIKGVLDASLHGAALLDLGIKQDPEAVTKYPWAIKKESTDETLPAGISMREIFDSIGMGRSLLILGAPGSGKTTMLLELARQLIARAREDAIAPIPMVFNLASWTEKLSLAAWLAQELNNLYSVPRKTAPDWVKGNKLVLLLDGLDEVRQDSRAKCVEAINAFRKEHGMTSLAVCSRSQDYADLNAKLSFEGAIEVQPLTQKQITEFFNRFGDGMLGIKQALEMDSNLREIAETPLFLSIMLMTYRDKKIADILLTGDKGYQPKHLFEAYVTSMFDRPRARNSKYKNKDILRWLSWLANLMRGQGQTIFLFDRVQRSWFQSLPRRLMSNILMFGLLGSFVFGTIATTIDRIYQPYAICFIGLGLGITIALIAELQENQKTTPWKRFARGLSVGIYFGLFYELIEYSFSNYYIVFYIGLVLGFGLGFIGGVQEVPSEQLKWSWKKAARGLTISILIGLGGSALIFGVFSLWAILTDINSVTPQGIAFVVIFFLAYAIMFGYYLLPILILFLGIEKLELKERTRSDQGIRNSKFYAFIFGIITFLLTSVMFQEGSHFAYLKGGLFGIAVGLYFGGYSVLNYYFIRTLLLLKRLMPWKYEDFLDHCVDLIFLRRVGGGYIFVHRLLMEHFAEMYVETPTSKGNQK
jgi:MFS family permease